MLDFIRQLFKPKADVAKLVREGAIIIDVRTKGEYGAGHIEGSKNIPLDEIKSQVNKLKQTNKPIVIVCRSGSRSGMAKAILTSAGVEAVHGQTLKDKFNNYESNIAKLELDADTKACISYCHRCAGHCCKRHHDHCIGCNFWWNVFGECWMLWCKWLCCQQQFKQ